MFSFENQVVVVTGASGISIGRTIAKHFYQANAYVAIASSNEERIQSTAREIAGDDKQRMLACKMNGRRVEEIRSFAEKVIERYGRIDVWVNNAGVHYPKPTLEVTEEDWDNTVDLNLKGYFFGAQCALSDMIKHGGCIINIGSVNSSIVTIGEVAYAATKAGISKMTENMAREFGPYGIRINCVAPGSIPTSMNKEQYSDLRVHQAMCDKLPLRRRGEADEIADAVLYLASPYAKYITGQTIFVDGGLTIVRG